MAPISNDIADSIALEPRSSVAVADPCTIVIFGASGDLTRRKLIPALFELAACQSLARRFAIIGFARSEMTDAAFQDSVAEAVRENAGTCQVNDESLRNFAQSFVYVAGDYDRAGRLRRSSRTASKNSTASAIWRAIACTTSRRRRPFIRR